MYCCLECGRKFKTIAAAERAADEGCPKCGSVDIDLDTRINMRPSRQIDTNMLPVDAGAIRITHR